MAKGTIVYMGIFELPDKNAAAHRVVNNGKIFTALGYRTVFLGAVRGEHFTGIRKSSYDDNVYEESYPLGVKDWLSRMVDTKNIEAVAEKYPDTLLIITYNVPLITYKAIKKVFAKKGIKVAYDCTEWNDYTVGSLPKRLYKKHDEKLIRTKLHKHCDDIIVISSMMEKQYQGKNLLRLPPLVDIEDPIWHQEKIEHDGVFEFCFAGTVGVKDRVDIIVNAFRELDRQDVRLKVIGITEEEYRQLYGSDSEQIDKDERIQFMGRVSHKESIKFVLSCDCYIFIREKTRQNQAGFPTKFVEAYTCGVPIISTNVSDINKYADKRSKSISILDKDYPEYIKEVMDYMLSYSQKSKMLKSDFNYSNYIEEVNKWLIKLL